MLATKILRQALRNKQVLSLTTKALSTYNVAASQRTSLPKMMSFGKTQMRAFSTDYEDDDYFTGYDTEDDGITYPASEAYIGKPAPAFSGKAVEDGQIVELNSSDYLEKWTVLLFYPKDFTFVCPTEIIAFSDRHKEFQDLGAQVIACSTDTPESHLAWTRMARKQGGLGKMNIPLLADVTKLISAQYGVLNETEGIAFRGLFLINPEGVLEHYSINNFPVGRSVDETIRLLQAFQFVAEHGEVCPANWKPGDATIIADPEDSQKYFASGATESEVDQHPTTTLTTISTAKEYEDLIASGQPVVFDFMADWCGKCQQILPYIESLDESYDNVKFVKVDVTKPELEALKEKLGVEALPTFQFFKDGEKVADDITGYKKRSILSQVENLL